MAKRPSPKPETFASNKERDYWHMAQDIAYRACQAVVYCDGAVWLEGQAGADVLCRPVNAERVWYEAWLELDRRYPALSRLWVGGQVITKPRGV